MANRPTESDIQGLHPHAGFELALGRHLESADDDAEATDATAATGADPGERVPGVSTTGEAMPAGRPVRVASAAQARVRHAAGPATIWVVRHGQSAGNVARDAAEAAGLPLIDITTRDVDTPLSELGVEQSRSLGRWFAALPPDERPQRVLCSPYVRARHTAELVVDALRRRGSGPLLLADERLREKEFGILDRLTRSGVRSKYPDLAEQMTHVGKFYFRPPGGESWCDVILRLRSLIETSMRESAGERLLVVAHQVTVNCLRYLIERLDERDILDIDRQGDVPNCSVTSYEWDATLATHGDLRLKHVNFVAPLHDEGTPVTIEPDAPAAAKP